MGVELKAELESAIDKGSVNFVTPFLGGIQGKLPSYMADFFVQALQGFDVAGSSKINTSTRNLVYPIEYAPTGSASEVIFYGPDSILLLFKRAFSSRDQYLFIRVLSLLRYVQYWFTYSRLSKDAPIITVGFDDAVDFRSRGFRNVHFLRHPVEASLPCDRTIKDKQKLTIGISGSLGRFGKFYAGKWLKYLTKILSTEDLTHKLQFLIVGKQYGDLARAIDALGYSVSHHQWIDDYTNFLESIDIYLALLAVGAGTKNRVLAANSAGLKVIGTPYALENVVCPQNICVSTLSDLRHELSQIDWSEDLYLSTAEQLLFMKSHGHSVCLRSARVIFEELGWKGL